MNSTENRYKYAHNIKKRNGITLLEIILAMAILGFVIMMAYNFNDFSQRVFSKGVSVADVQFNMRTASAYITDEVRFSSSVEVLKSTDPIPNTISNNDFYVYVKNNGSKQALAIKDKNGERILAESTTVNLLVEAPTLSKTLFFEVSGTYRGQTFKLDSEVAALNLPEDQYVVDNTAAANGIFIKGTRLDASVAVPTGLYFGNAPPDATKGVAYSHSFSASGGTSPYSFSKSAGDLPTGVSLSGGTLHGTPSAVGTYVFTITVTDGGGKTASRAFDIAVTESVDPMAPIATDLVIAGPPYIGGTLTANYLYTDPDPASASPLYGFIEQSITTWYRMDDPIGTNMTVVKSEVSTFNTPSTYSIASSDAGKYIKFELKPANTKPLEGATVSSFPTTQISINSAPEAKNPIVSLVGSNTSIKNIVTLKGQYTYYDADGDHEGISTIQWYYSNKSNAQFSDLIVYPNGTSSTISIADKIYENKYFYFSVIPKAQTGKPVGDRTVSAHTGPFPWNK